jgi:hypothetical protein
MRTLGLGLKIKKTLNNGSCSLENRVSKNTRKDARFGLFWGQLNQMIRGNEDNRFQKAGGQGFEIQGKEETK